MTRMTFAAVAAVSALLTTGANAGTIANVFTSYYAFGDSLTDDGKLPDFFLNPISDDGRFSNGPTYAEYIAQEFEDAGLDNANLAIGGATANDRNDRPIDPLSNFKGQLDAFQMGLDDGKDLPVRTGAGAPEASPPTPGSNPLVSILLGANDVFQSTDDTLIGDDPIPVDVKRIEDAAASVAAGITRIASLDGGELFTNFFVMDLPDFEQSNVFNDKLALELTDLKDANPDLNIITFDTSAVFDFVLADIFGAQTLGITGLGPCIESLSSADGPSCLDEPGFDANTLALVDSVHPNAVVHRVLGQQAIAALNASVAPVPLPASLPLVLVGFAAFGTLRLRRAA